MSKHTHPQAEAAAPSGLSRRTLFAGAGAAGAVVAAATALPLPKPAEAVAQAKLPEPDAGGYQLTEHVKRYYQTARV